MQILLRTWDSLIHAFSGRHTSVPHNSNNVETTVINVLLSVFELEEFNGTALLFSFAVIQHVIIPGRSFHPVTVPPM